MQLILCWFIAEFAIDFQRSTKLINRYWNKKLFPIWNRHVENNNCQYITQNMTVDSSYEPPMHFRKFMKIHLHKIEFKENLILNRQK